MLPYFLKTSHLDSHTTNDVKPEMLSGVQTGNRIPHDRYNVRGIAHARSYKKDNIFMQRRQGQIFTCILKWGQITCKKLRPNWLKWDIEQGSYGSPLNKALFKKVKNQIMELLNQAKQLNFVTAQPSMTRTSHGFTTTIMTSATIFTMFGGGFDQN